MLSLQAIVFQFIQKNYPKKKNFLFEQYSASLNQHINWVQMYCKNVNKVNVEYLRSL